MNLNTNVKLPKPFVKWAGGKTQLLSKIKEHVPENINNYYEPFAGGAAVLFNILKHKNVQYSYINDSNSELINLYTVVQSNVEDLIEDLKEHENSKEYYVEVRKLDRDPEVYAQLNDVQKASRFLFLNKTCFNGLYRVNKQGHFNTPFGDYKNPCICDEKNLRECSLYLKNVNIYNLSYIDFVFKIYSNEDSDNDFFYFDPPYLPLTKTSNFTSYTSDGFGIEDHKKLKEVCDYLNGLGVKFLMSNSSLDEIRDLYKNYKVMEVSAKRNINSSGDKRGNVTELLIKNYD